MSQERMEITGVKPLTTPNFAQAPDIDTTLSDATKAVSKNRVLHGANERYYDLSGKTIGAVKKTLRDDLNIPSDAEGYVLANGVATKVGDDFVIQPGMSLEFSKEAGEKGVQGGTSPCTSDG